MKKFSIIVFLMGHWNKLTDNSRKFSRSASELATAGIAFRLKFIKTIHPGNTVSYTEERRGIFDSVENTYINVTSVDGVNGLTGKWPP